MHKVHQFLKHLKILGTNLEEFEEKYYNKYGKHLEIKDFYLVFNVQFKNYELPIHNNHETIIIKANSKNEKPDDGLNMYLTPSKIIFKLNNVDISTENLAHLINEGSVRSKLPLGDLLTEKIINSVIGNLSELEYNFNKKTSATILTFFFLLNWSSKIPVWKS